MWAGRAGQDAISLPMSFMEKIGISVSELGFYDGLNGRPAYIAYRGRIYDVTASYSWRNGSHQVFHKAGCDLTSAMKDAPHGEDLLSRFPVVGWLSRA